MSDGKTDIERLYIDCYQRMLSMARAMLKDDEEARDAVGDLFAKVADGSLVLPPEHPEGYLSVTMRNICLDRIRKMTIRERIERRLTFSEPNLTPVETEQVQAAEMIDYAERTFPKQTWCVFQLRFDEGLKYREIAERLGISEVTVYKNLTEALRILKEKYNPTRR
ncbi:MAG: sigma-70 family RNA polymerase sigma factor [Prevotella sp.]|nr:sigma-70 family RNA polymerase sigma factor [Prevotella sp.]